MIKQQTVHPYIFAGIPRKTFEITPEDIIDDVANHFKVHPKRIKDMSRIHRYLHPRQLAMCLLRVIMHEKSLRWIGLQFGGRDHSTVLHSFRQVANALEVDESYREFVDPILQKYDIKYVDIFKLLKERK